MSNAVAELLTILDLERIEENIFRGRSPQVGSRHVFGGLVVAQALVAAARTVEGRTPHSLHGYFLLLGDPAVPIVYEVDRIRDGKSFTTRRCNAIQHGRAIFSLSASFQIEEAGFEHAFSMPKVPFPESLPTETEMLRRPDAAMPEAMRRWFAQDLPIEVRPVDLPRYVRHQTGALEQQVWLRATGPLPGDPAIHRAVLAYLSDMTFLAPCSPHMVIRCSTPASRSRASIMPCGFTGRFAPTIGFSTPKTAQTPAAPAVWRAGSFSPMTAASLPRWSRKALSARRRPAGEFCFERWSDALLPK